MIQFVANTDRQLWVHEEASFTQSFWVTGGKIGDMDAWLVSLPFSQIMPREVRDQVTSYLHHGSISRDPFNILVPDQYLRDYARPVHGTNPSYWNRYKSINTPKPVTLSVEKKPAAEEAEKEEARKVSDERFLRMAWKMSPIADYRVFRLVWLAITQAMPHRLLVDMVPIDFGWAKIHAFPYRKNWKQIVLSRMPNCNQQFQNSAGRTVYQKALTTELPSHIRNTVLIALHKDDVSKNRFGWTLEIEESAEFDRWANDVEIERHKTTSRREYATQWASIINKQATDIVQVFYRFMRQTILPAAQLGKGSDSGIGGLVPYLASNGNRPSRVDDVDVDPVSVSAGELRDDNGRRIVVGKAKNLPTLPVLRAVPSYLREPGGDSAAIEWSGSDENRMLVLGAAGGDGQTQDVLAAVARGDGGLERVVGQGEVIVKLDHPASKSE